MSPDLPPGALTDAAALRTRGFSRSAIARCVESGELIPEPRARGLYTIAGRQLSLNHDLLVIALYAPAATFCLLTALQLLALRGPAPDIWLSVPASARMPAIKRVPIVEIRPRNALPSGDIEVVEIEGIQLRHTSAAKTVADCFQYRSKVGLDIAVEALRAARRRGAATMDEIWLSATAGGVGGVMLPYLEVMG